MLRKPTCLVLASLVVMVAVRLAEELDLVVVELAVVVEAGAKGTFLLM